MKIPLRNMILTAFFTTLTIIGAKINILIFEIPITLQPIIITMAGCLIGSKAAFLSQIVYIMLGLIGIPVFAKSSAGPAYLLQPSFGYLIGFAFAAFIIGRIIEISNKKSVGLFIVSSMAGLIVIYFFGVIYIYGLFNIYMKQDIDIFKAVSIGILPFIIKDTIMNIFTSALSYTIYRRITK